MNINTSIHQVTRVKVTPIDCLDKEGQSGTFYREIQIYTENERFDITIFSSDRHSLSLL